MIQRPRRPSQDIPTVPHGLWSLWDMLEAYGYGYVGIGDALANLRAAVLIHRDKDEGSKAGHGTTTIAPGSPVASFIVGKCDEVLKLIPEEHQELDGVKFDLEMMKANVATGVSGEVIYANDILRELDKIKGRLTYRLSKCLFYYVQPELAKYYGKPAQFGEAVAKKFPDAREDIERAGNCLALGEPTACVLHLNRAMEVAIHRLARRLKIVTDAKDNMGSVLGKMTEPIRQMPDKTEAQKRKKEKWAECRTNLYHVKMAWRDPSSHGKQSYDEKEALDIFRRVSDFMQQLATL